MPWPRPSDPRDLRTPGRHLRSDVHERREIAPVRRKVPRDLGSLTDSLRADARIRPADTRILAKVAGIRSADPRLLRQVVHDLAEIPHYLRALPDDLRSVVENLRLLARDLAERVGYLREDAGKVRADSRERRPDPRDLRPLAGCRRPVVGIRRMVAGNLGVVVRILGGVWSNPRSLAGILATLPRMLVAPSGGLRSLVREQPALAGGRRTVPRRLASFAAHPSEDARLPPLLPGIRRSVAAVPRTVVAQRLHRRPNASHGHTPGATLLTAVMRLWHELSLPPDAVVMHVLAYWALTAASSGQHDIRFAQAPVDEPPSPPDDAPLEPALAEQVDEQLLVRHEKTGPSQFAQVLVTHP